MTEKPWEHLRKLSFCKMWFCEIFSQRASFKSQRASTACASMFWERSGAENKSESLKIYSKSVFTIFCLILLRNALFRRLSMQKRVAVQLKGECFAPPLAMNHKNALRWTDSGMDVGSPSTFKLWRQIPKTARKAVQLIRKSVFFVWCAVSVFQT